MWFINIQIVNSQNVIVDGNSFLELQSIHDSVKVVFNRTAPSGYIDSVYSDSAGHFTISIPTGIYDINYSKDQFIPVNLTGNVLFSNTTLSDTTLESLGLNGQLSGILLAGTYKVGDDIEVASGDTLIINAGVTLLFKADKKFEINGLLWAIGTQIDSITLSKYDSSDWAGLIFNSISDSSSILTYSRIEYAVIGLKVNQCTPHLSQIKLNNNVKGMGVFATGKSISLDNFTIINNHNDNSFSLNGNNAAGIDVVGSPTDSVELRNFRILNNSNTNHLFNNLTIGGLWAGGLKLKLINSIVAGNSGQTGGIYFDSAPGQLEVYNSTIVDNTAQNIYGLYSCVGGVLYWGFLNPIYMYNSIIAFNNAPSGALCGGLFDRHFITPEIRYNDFWNNSPGDYCTDSISFINFNVTVNANGDSCDVYNNIRFNPNFMNQPSQDYHLNNPNILVDAGNNLYVNTSLDLDGNPRIIDGDNNTSVIVDMGAYESLGPNSVNYSYDNTHLILFPNPVNDKLNVAISNNQLSEIILYDIASRKILEQKFINSVSLNTEQLGKGIYIYQVRGRNGWCKKGKVVKD